MHDTQPLLALAEDVNLHALDLTGVALECKLRLQSLHSSFES
jgi:hypothetical protein